MNRGLDGNEQVPEMMIRSGQLSRQLLGEKLLIGLQFELKCTGESSLNGTTRRLLRVVVVGLFVVVCTQRAPHIGLDASIQPAGFGTNGERVQSTTAQFRSDARTGRYWRRNHLRANRHVLFVYTVEVYAFAAGDSLQRVKTLSQNELFFFQKL